MTPKTPIPGLQKPARDLPAEALAELASIVGQDNLLVGIADRYAYCRDRLPYGLFKLRSGELPATLPSGIVCPADESEVRALVQWARRRKCPLIPFGAGSGVLGGTIPLVGELMVDLKRLNRILDINTTDGIVTVQAGMNGLQFEEALCARGYTAGHLPQSIAMSTVGGWAACRGAGQASSRFGKIEDIVLGLKAVLPDGQLLEVRPVARRSVGPSIKDLLVGSEGVFGLITQLTLRMWRKPEHERAVVLAFPTLEAALSASREIMQTELRPEVVRLYDRVESAQRTEGMAEFLQRPFLAIMKFSGKRELVEAEYGLALEICTRHDAVKAASQPYDHWVETRFHSYSTKWQTDGYYMDTIEITGAWSRLPSMYQAMRNAILAIHPDIHFGAHWSHVYPEGACQYMTIRLPPMPEDQALKLHHIAWDNVESICLEAGGTIAHHHGAGLFRARWLQRELNAGMNLLQTLKDGMDPDNLFNPGKLGLRQPAGTAWTSERL